MTAETAFERLVEAFGFEDLSKDSEAHLREMVAATLSGGETDERSPEQQKMYGIKNMAVTAFLHELAARGGARWTTFQHTNTRIQTTSIGNWADRFGGNIDNTDIGKNLRQLIAP